MYDEVLISLSLLAAVLSLALGVGFRHTVRRLGTLSAAPGSDEEHPVVDVVMPARNEEFDLEKAVLSVLAQQSVAIRVIIVNDHSTDGTRQIADSLAARDSRVTVIHDPRLVDGWLGKTNALQHGLAASTAPYVVFADADVIHEPQCFVTALAELRKRQIDFLSLCPRFEFESFWENVILPHAFIAGTLQFAVQNVNNDESPNAAAAGAFMLTRRDVLQRVGELERIKAEVLDDVALARLIKHSGFRTRITFAPELLRVRLFKGNHDAFWGLTKNILTALDHLWLAVPAMFLPVFIYWVPIATVVLGIVRPNNIMIAAGMSAYVIQAGLLLLLLRFCRFRSAKALFFPLAAIPVMCCIGKALYHRWATGAVAWRGRVLPLRSAERL
jgi:glycosyltransferase involved in cell wall biosynthesis